MLLYYAFMYRSLYYYKIINSSEEAMNKEILKIFASLIFKNEIGKSSRPKNLNPATLKTEPPILFQS